MSEKRALFAKRVKTAVDSWRDLLVHRVRTDEGFSLLLQKHWLLLVAEKMDDTGGAVVEDHIDEDQDAACMVAAGLIAIEKADKV